MPLGSIQELPAESCSEIKVSEGNEMANGDYWIYSDGNGQTILARCEGTAICLLIKKFKILATPKRSMSGWINRSANQFWG